MPYHRKAPDTHTRQIDSARVQQLAREDFREWERTLPELDDATARRLWNGWSRMFAEKGDE